MLEVKAEVARKNSKYRGTGMQIRIHRVGPGMAAQIETVMEDGSVLKTRGKRCSRRKAL